MNVGGILYDNHRVPLLAGVPELADCGSPIAEEAVTIGRVGPGTGDHTRTILRAYVVDVAVDDGVDSVARDETLLDEQRLECPSPQLDLACWPRMMMTVVIMVVAMVVVVVVVMVMHYAASK